MIARLPMYDWPELKFQHEALWQHLAAVLREDLPEEITVPECLLEDGDQVQQWLSESLLVGQTCGLPFAQGLYKHTCLLGSPVYRLENCSDGEYYSVIVTGADIDSDAICFEQSEGAIEEGQGLRAAINARDSQSGYSALLHSLSRNALSQLCISGSHRQSIQMLAAGEADVASIDAVSWTLAKRYEPAAKTLKVVGYSQPTPCLPMITGLGVYSACISESLIRGLASLDDALKDDLLLEGLMPRKAEEYLFLSPRLTRAKQKHNIA
ncbi:phosphate/phosphite/phosphonate ABC transporter substrate-binding protein [Aliamphritea ceti]|uniref:phosphate/phosphite/phosphonate ABC transporter substrate-binding protein n=1 Tax=Aliamphritea ceti TaxID=1524258 RepID=UPI0021C297BA|nr:PhnD/SsuA/transferrin family substrate-binding protein [Aliamphritea ceti]